MSYDSARSDEATCAESDAANDRCVRADRNPFFDPCFHRRPVCVATARCQIVSQNGVWTKEYVVCDVHVLPDADSVFDSDVVADADSALDESVIADVALRADNHILQHVSERPDTSAFTNRICFYQRFLVDESGVFRFDHKVDDNNRCSGYALLRRFKIRYPTATTTTRIATIVIQSNRIGRVCSSDRIFELFYQKTVLKTNSEQADAETQSASPRCSASFSMIPRSDK